MRILVSLSFLLIAVSNRSMAQDLSPEAVLIAEVIYNHTPHFKVETGSASYFIEKQSGGCSSLLDSAGRDWIGFKLTGTGGPTLSSDSDFRGVPNLVFQDPGNGIGHPGFNTCETVKVSANELEVTSLDKLWLFRWIFHESHAEIVVEKTDPSRAYWFLYEGPVAGNFAPHRHYWGNDADGLRTDTPSIFKDPVCGNWQWAFFGDTNLAPALFVAHEIKDELDDFFCYMGNNAERANTSEDGMNVFGFGRSLRTEPLMKGSNHFYIGFFPGQVSDKKTVRKLRKHIRQIIQ